MSSYTSNLNLYKPDATDDYDEFRVEFGNNMDKIDQSGGGGGGGGTVGGAVYMGAELLWEGSFSGTGTINVPNLDQYLVIAVQNDVSVLVIGNNFTGSGAIGLYNSNSMYNYAYRFNNSVANKLTVDSNNRGLIRSTGVTTAGGGEWCTITKIYGLVKKSGADGRGGTTFTTTEQVVGTWLGKPLYQMTIPFSGINLAANTYYGINISSYVTDYETMFLMKDMSYYMINNAERLFTEMTLEPPTVYIKSNVARTNISGHFVVRYTKTTD